MIGEHESARVRDLLGDAGGRGGRRVFSAAGKTAAAELAREGQRNGISVAKTAATLGVHAITLLKWMRSRPKGNAAFASVVRVDPSELPRRAPRAEWVVEHRSGVRVVGLSVDDVAALFRSLG